ncbi:tRNA-modifying protein YgfZ [Utexia brackfieldae]|uniref:tRNA-modifying protein YgfZ n=1 Tax=Utexia brackfieldae TaxID=3074108 RepID=UPI00370DB218
MNIQLANTLPCCFMSLKHWQLVKVTGQDALSYLQGQFTQDLNKLTEIDFLFSGHCDPTGKILSNMLVYKQHETYYYLERRSVAEQQVADLKKYAVFSKVVIEIDHGQQLLGVAGEQAGAMLQQLNLTLPDEASQTMIHQDNLTIIRLAKPAARFLLIGESTHIAMISQQLIAQGAQPTEDNQWLALDIEASYPLIDAINFAQFLPQAMSLEKIDGISFDKGCYRGQEMVARAQFRGANKRALFSLIGTSSVLPPIGEGLVLILGEHQRESGHVLAAVRLADDRLFVQAILNRDITLSDQFKVKQDPDSQLTIVSDDVSAV